METTYSEEIATAATAVLANSSVSELRRLRVDRQENELRLSGNVRSFYHKQLAQETVRTVAGDMRLINEVDVTA